MALFDQEGKLEFDKMLLMEVWKAKSIPATFNVGGSSSNIGATFGYSPNALMSTFEGHVGFFIDVPKLLRDGSFVPKIGFGVTAKW